MTVDERAVKAAGREMPGTAARPDRLIEQARVGSALWKEIHRLRHLALVFPAPPTMASSWNPAAEEAQRFAAADAIPLTFTPLRGRICNAQHSVS